LSHSKSLQVFKGIALFTPGGDLIYCIDRSKQQRWHLQLCMELQQILGLPEPPHFLVPCYTATLDCWLDPQTQHIQTFAEAYPLVMRHQALLNAVFDVGELVWQAAPWSEEFCDPIALATYRACFPQLWDDRGLIVRFDPSTATPHMRYDATANFSQTELKAPEIETTVTATEATPAESQYSEKLGYVLRLFVAGHSVNTERILQTLHQLLEQSLRHPYTLKVVDVFKHPEQAELYQVSATPTLVRAWPHPVRRLVGDLDNTAKILKLLISPEL
jgi:circadian clock protein KaiB